jgi:hypothetical protein
VLAWGLFWRYLGSHSTAEIIARTIRGRPCAPLEVARSRRAAATGRTRAGASLTPRTRFVRVHGNDPARYPFEL